MISYAKQVDFIGVGDQKSATTWIYGCLCEHPEICTSSTKETRFFDDDFLYGKSLEKYSEFFSHCGDDKVVGEYSPSYIHSKKAMERVKKDVPNAKIIVCFRDPVEKIHSAYRFNKVSGTGAMKRYDSFLEAVKSEDSLLERAKHGRNLDRVYEYFSRDQVFVGIYDDLQKEPKRFIQEIYAFLEVDDSFVPDSVKKKYNVTGDKEFRSDFFAKILAQIANSIKRWGSLKSTLSKIGGKGFYRRIRSLNRTESGNRRSKREIPPSAERKIRDVLTDDITKLEELVDRDLSRWKL
jgi:hypothetical protein